MNWCRGNRPKVLKEIQIFINITPFITRPFADGPKTIVLTDKVIGCGCEKGCKQSGEFIQLKI